MRDRETPKDDAAFQIRLAYLDDRTCLYRPFIRPATARVLNRAVFGGEFSGSTDPSALSLLSMFVAICQPERVLELGTYHGFSTLVFAELLSSNARRGRIITVEPDEAAQEDARRQVQEAGLASVVRFVRGFSTDEQVVEAALREAPYDIIYIDTSHHYEPTLAELDVYLIRRRMVRPGGLIFLHDITYPMGNDRGVGAAVEDWLKRHPEFRYLPLTRAGVWPNPCGLGILLAPTEGNV